MRKGDTSVVNRAKAASNEGYDAARVLVSELRKRRKPA